MDKEYKTLTWTTILFAGANIVSKLLKILLLPLYTYCLTTSEFGTAETIIITVNLLYPVFLVGVSEAALRFSLNSGYSAESVISNCFAVMLTASMAGLLLFIPMARMPFLGEHIAVMYIMTVAAAVESLLKAEAKGLGENTAFAVSEIISATALIACNALMLVVLKSGIEGYLWSIAAASAARIIFLSIRLKLIRLIVPRTVSREMIKAILKFSLPFMPATILWWIMDSSGRYLVMWFAGASAAGIYAVAFRLSAMVTSMSVVFHQAWQLSAIRRYSQGGYETFYRSAMESYSTLFFAGSALLIAFAKPVIMLLDDSYEDAWRYAPVLLIAAVFFALSGLVCANYYVCERTYGVLWTSLAGASISVLSGVILTKTIGIQGAAIAAMLSFYMLWMIMSVHTGRMLGIRHDYVIIHVDLLIVIAETVCVLKQLSPLLTALCIAALIIVNRKPVSRMMKGILPS